MFGIVKIGGVSYVERPQVFPEQLNVTVALARINNQNLVLPGVAKFMLKGLARQVIAANAPAVRAFLWRFGNTDGGLWYSSAGTAGASDMVIDTNIFGSGQFPFPLVPHILYEPTANINYEFEDLSNTVPYVVHFAFYGSYLIPV